jgi:hypothetical protein
MATVSDEPTYDSPSAFFAMDFEDDNAMSYDQHPDFSNPFKPNSKLNQSIDPMLSNNHMNLFNLDTNFWNDPSQFGVLQTVNPTLSPLGGNQSCDTGYVSQEGSNSRSPPSMDAPVGKRAFSQAQSTSKPRKRSGTKSTTLSKAADDKVPRKARRTSKAASAIELDDLPEDDDKREQFLARNREAASKCRQKKKEWTQDLEQKARDLSAQKQMLTTYMAVLKNELLMLKCKCLEHSDCGCEAIRDYLKNTVNTMPPASAALYSRLDDKNAANDIANEIARKQSSASAFDYEAMSTPESMIMSPSSIGDMDVDLKMFEELKAASKD